MKALKLEQRKRSENMLLLQHSWSLQGKLNDFKDQFEAGMWAFGACKEESRDFHEVGNYMLLKLLTWKTPVKILYSGIKFLLLPNLIMSMNHIILIFLNNKILWIICVFTKLLIRNIILLEGLCTLNSIKSNKMCNRIVMWYILSV